MPRPKYIRRSLEPVLKKAAREFPAVILSGPRQSGKTTVLKRLFARSHDYVSLELPDVRATALHDPRGFLESRERPLILDEVQFAPELLPYVKERIDADRHATGRFLLSGSQNILLLESVSESLAGRVAVLKLMPLSWRERASRPAAPLPWRTSKRTERPAISISQLWKGFLRGGFPELHAWPKRDVHLWYSSYIQTYLERDVRTLRQVGDLGEFQRFLRMLAARSAQLLNLSELARDLGIAVNTAKGWISVLEATHQITILRPYFANLGKRLVKTPKVYFNDVGILCHLTGLREPEHAASGPMAGAILETAVLSEIQRALFGSGVEPRVHFLRTSDQHEIDFLVEEGQRVVPIEVKQSATPNPRMAATIEKLHDWAGGKAGPGFVVHPGRVETHLSPNCTALPFAKL